MDINTENMMKVLISLLQQYLSNRKSIQIDVALYYKLNTFRAMQFEYPEVIYFAFNKIAFIPY